MKTNLIVILSLLGCLINVKCSICQELAVSPAGAENMAVGGTFSVASGFWATHGNPAGLSELETIVLGAQYQNHFLTETLSYQSFGVAIPTAGGSFGLSYAQFGYSLYKEQKIGLSYGKNLGENISGGIRFDYFSTKLPEVFGDARALTFELGFQAKLTENLSIGAHTLNPVQVKRSKNSIELLPTTFTIGMLVAISDQLKLTTEVHKDLRFEPVLRGGLSYYIKPEIFTGIGFSTIPSHVGAQSFSVGQLYSFGFGMEFSQLRFALAAGLHPGLGWTPTASLTTKIGGKVVKTQ